MSKIKLLDVREYIIRPAQNGWILEFTDRISGEKFTAIFPTSADIAKWARTLDPGRKRADAESMKRKTKGDDYCDPDE
jgi:hypothetical protein